MIREYKDVDLPEPDAPVTKVQVLKNVFPSIISVIIPDSHRALDILCVLCITDNYKHN